MSAINWVLASGLLGLSTLFMLVLLGMLANLLNMKELRMWVRAEYAQIAVTFLIIAAAASMNTVGNDMAGTITCAVAQASGGQISAACPNGGSINPFDLGRSYLRDTVISCQSRLYYKLAVL